MKVTVLAEVVAYIQWFDPPMCERIMQIIPSMLYRTRDIEKDIHFLVKCYTHILAGKVLPLELMSES